MDVAPKWKLAQLVFATGAGGLQMKMKLLCAVAVLLWASVAAIAEPLVTISCEKPDGFSLAYGVSFSDRLNASSNNQPEPTKPSLKGPVKDGYAGKPTFVIDLNKKKMTMIWGELPDDIQLRKRAKELGLPQLPPPAAEDAIIVWFSKDQINGVLVEPWSITSYSFFPKMGTAFISQQSLDLGMKNSRQIATFAHCEFSWAMPQ